MTALSLFPDTSSMGFYWCSRRNRKRKNRISGNGSTPGKTKGGTCQADYKKRHMAKSSRSYKHQDYGMWLEFCRNPTAVKKK
jgi:hypothetical protein